MHQPNDSGNPRHPARPDQVDTAQGDRNASDAEKFDAYHKANPIVLETMIKEARRWMTQRPGAPLGIALLVGRVRWVLTMKLQADGDGFRINDHYAPAYARLVMHYAPDTKGLFKLRRTQWADDYLDAIRRAERDGEAA